VNFKFDGVGAFFDWHKPSLPAPLPKGEGRVNRNFFFPFPEGEGGQRPGEGERTPDLPTGSPDLIFVNESTHLCH
jgi:hypothetical protein